MMNSEGDENGTVRRRRLFDAEFDKESFINAILQSRSAMFPEDKFSLAKIFRTERTNQLSLF